MIDPLKRFSPTPYTAYLTFCGLTARIETNSPGLLDRLQSLGSLPKAQDAPAPDCIFKVVTEPDQQALGCADDLITYSASDDHLSLVSIGPDSFLGYDRRSRLGISFISEKLVLDERLFATYFVPGLRFVLRSAGDAS